MSLQTDRGRDGDGNENAIYLFSWPSAISASSFKTSEHPRETLHFCKPGAGDAEQFASMA